MGDTRIEWSEKVWNPVRGCSRVSPGCENCYAERQSARFCDPGQYAHGYAERTAAGARWTRRVALIPEKLAEPLSWRKPALVFVNSMSDLFHEKLTDEEIAAVFGVMASCPHLTFQVLTKRADRLPGWFAWAGSAALDLCACKADDALQPHVPRIVRAQAFAHWSGARVWPLPNVWLGVSVEDQQRADERIPHLLAAPAAVRFLSCEPLLGSINLTAVGSGQIKINALNGGWAVPRNTDEHRQEPRIHWVICGGESGPGARPMDIAWMRLIKEQCAAVGLPYFGKQVGSRPAWDGCARPGELWPPGTKKEDDMEGRWSIHLKDRKGGDPAEWPEDLRVRQMPEVHHA